MESGNILRTSIAAESAAVPQFLQDAAQLNSMRFLFEPGKALAKAGLFNAAAPVWDDDSRTIYFNALAGGLQGIFKANVDGTISRITSDTQWCDYNSPFAVQKSDKGTTLLASWCSMDFPTELVSISAEDGSTVQITKENEHILSQLADHKMEARMVKTVDGKDMLTWVMYPPQFDSTKVYPSILICLGGPQGTISQSWSYRWNYRIPREGYRFT